MPIDELEFRRILHLFPVVRSRDYNPDSESSSQSTSSSKVNENEWQDVLNDADKKYADSHRIDCHDAFWEKLKLVAEKKMGPTEAEKLCKAFQKVYRRLVYEELSLDAARSFINSSGNFHS